jgi:hypothetical protein
MKKEILKFTNTPSFSTFIYSIMDEKSFLLPSLSSSTSSLPTSDSVLSLGTLCVACDGFACGKCDVCDGNGDAWGAGEAKFLREKKRSCKIVSEFYFSFFFAGRRRRSQQSRVLEFAGRHTRVEREREREREEFFFPRVFHKLLLLQFCC